MLAFCASLLTERGFLIELRLGQFSVHSSLSVCVLELGGGRGKRDPLLELSVSSPCQRALPPLFMSKNWRRCPR